MRGCGKRHKPSWTEGHWIAGLVATGLLVALVFLWVWLEGGHPESLTVGKATVKFGYDEENRALREKAEAEARARLDAELRSEEAKRLAQREAFERRMAEEEAQRLREEAQRRDARKNRVPADVPPVTPGPASGSRPLIMPPAPPAAAELPEIVVVPPDAPDLLPQDTPTCQADVDAWRRDFNRYGVTREPPALCPDQPDKVEPYGTVGAPDTARSELTPADITNHQLSRN